MQALRDLCTRQWLDVTKLWQVAGLFFFLKLVSVSHNTLPNDLRVWHIVSECELRTWLIEVLAGDMSNNWFLCDCWE